MKQPFRCFLSKSEKQHPKILGLLQGPPAASPLNPAIRSVHISQNTWSMSCNTAMKRCPIKTSSQASEYIQIGHTAPFFNLLKSVTNRGALSTFSKRNIQIKQSERKEERKERGLSALCQPIIFNREKDTSGYSFL